jgi:CheY-like chemotaxis protein
MVGESILLVEDEPAFRTALALALEGEGYKVLAATNGREALTLSAGMQPDLILSDVMMPELDGYGVLAEMRARLFQPPVILMSAAGRPPCEPPCLAALEKPFDLDELLDLVLDALADR